MMIVICFPIGLIAVMMAQFLLALSDHSLHGIIFSFSLSAEHCPSFYM